MCQRTQAGDGLSQTLPKPFTECSIEQVHERYPGGQVKNNSWKLKELRRNLSCCTLQGRQHLRFESKRVSLLLNNKIILGSIEHSEGAKIHSQYLVFNQKLLDIQRNRIMWLMLRKKDITETNSGSRCWLSRLQSNYLNSFKESKDNLPKK